MYPKIAIDGAQATGKTTLFHLLESDCGHVLRFIPEASRAIAPRFGVNSVSDWPALLRDKIRLKEFFQEEEDWQTEREDLPGPFVVASSLYLICAYKTYFGIHPNVTVAARRGYSLILYLPLTTDAHNDGFRFLDGRTEIDEIYLGLISDQATRTVTLPPGPNRGKLALETVSRHLRESGSFWQRQSTRSPPGG